MFKLSKRSLDNLAGVKPPLVEVVKLAITRTQVDFAVTEGVRTLAQQRVLVSKGASQTLNSKHLTGDAVDLVAFLGGRISWELDLYNDIAEAMRDAARQVGVGIRWGGAWSVRDIRTWDASMGEAMVTYIDQSRRAGRRPFIDAPHFELA